MFKLFLTGDKRAGKSTVIRAWASRAASAGGFLTVKDETVFPGRISVHMLDASKNESPSADNLLFFCGETESGAANARFCELGRAVFQNARKAEVIIMDELGPHEESAAGFQSEVMRLLDSDKKVIGVLQKADSAFLDRVKKHPNVRLIEVTKENRDALAGMNPFESREKPCISD